MELPGVINPWVQQVLLDSLYLCPAVTGKAATEIQALQGPEAKIEPLEAVEPALHPVTSLWLWSLDGVLSRGWHSILIIPAQVHDINLWRPLVDVILPPDLRLPLLVVLVLYGRLRRSRQLSAWHLSLLWQFQLNGLRR